MDDREFWTWLEYRVSRELEGFADKDISHLWCDGFLPGAVESGGDRPRVRGRAWVGHGQDWQEQWNFTLFLGSAAAGGTVPAWTDLCPAEDVTGWLAVDLAGRTLTIDPSRARPCLSGHRKPLAHNDQPAGGAAGAVLREGPDEHE
ncbi:hypothetical protein [Goodfellowiella coeruleoviolacea]|uniref:Uncharacterized protein n=1 Tax=Goodfellowiella coeruleoviolacea TaxID=334858 RepID=A0AAE3G818_9PSEU|nr:hypothetical protein [Goodfellowiella coeruleoviolacea]MCP2163421.1 hypothetical protein [Goodfellowiella coeruleoviolacea]